MVRARLLASVGVVLGFAALWPAASTQAQNPTSASAAHVAFDQQTFWQTTKVYCDSCHFGPKARAKLNLQALDLAHLDVNGVTWEKVLRKLRKREMPPAGMPRPERSHLRRARQVDRDASAIAWRRSSPIRDAPRSIGSTARNTRTPFAICWRSRSTSRSSLPADDIGYGFDNIGDVLQVSPVLLERYLSVARKISRTAVGDTTMPVAYQTYNVPHALRFRTIVWTKPRRSARAAARPSRHLLPGGRRIRDFGHALQRNRDDEYLGLERERKLDLQAR